MSENMNTPLVTIPGCVATHILDTNMAELGSGDLTLVAPPNTSGDVGMRRPVLTLTLGNAALPLYSSTEFGTVAGDERLYVFRPELGEDIKG